MSQLLFTGLSAFPLTPFRGGDIDEPSFTFFVEKLARSQVDSIAVLGSTGSYMYLSAEQRARAVVLAAESAREKPLIVGVSDMSTCQVLSHVKVAEDIGASGLLLAPVSYQPLASDEVFELYRTVGESTDLPIIVYDNPGTTHFTFDLDLCARLAELPGVVSIKIPPTAVASGNPVEAISSMRQVIPDDVGLGISGDGAAACGVAAVCDTWYSAVAGTLPDFALEIFDPFRRGDLKAGEEASNKYQPLWTLYAECGGSVRVMAAIAELKGWVGRSCLPAPLQPLPDALQRKVENVLNQLEQ
ncbi:dihydrodipicolinate synthase family protein [uncultured Rothia sp.]|uniref:dihydrodipicolinate synthase family protein n=1 Tax=uncultured Rothia sp. TaxID=316088 RepID=UPI0032173C64